MKILTRITLFFIISFTLIHFPILKAHAEMLSTTQIVTEMSRTQTEGTVQQFLARDDVKSELIKLGVDAKEASIRLAHLSNDEVRKLAGDIEKAKLGGDIAGVLLIVLLILGIIYLAKRI